MQIINCLVRVAAITALAVLLAACKSPPPPATGVDPTIASTSISGLRLGMTPSDVLEISGRRLFKEDQRNEVKLADLAQKERERATIRLDRVRSVAESGMHSFLSNAVTLTLQFARNRLITIEERHTGLGEQDLRNEMKELSTRFNFAGDRTDAGANVRWEYKGRNPNSFVRVDFRFVSNPSAKTAPMSSYTIVVSDPLWGSQAP